MKLSVKDRIILPLLLPKQGGFIEMQTVAGIINKLNFTPEEIHILELRSEQATTTWNAEKEKDIEIEFFPEQLAVIRSGIDQLDQGKAVSLEMLDTITKFRSL